MNTAWFEDFLALAANGNFSRAAEARHVTQPAFGRRIRAIEEWLGVSLFDRSSQPVQLTTAGHWFEKVARSTLDQIDRLPSEAKEVAQSHAATLKLAATHALSFTFVPTWLRSLESHLSVGPIQLVSDVLPRCQALLDKREAHFMISHARNDTHTALAAGDIRHPSLKIGNDTLILVSAVHAHGQVAHEVLPSPHGNTPFLAYSTDSGLGQILHASLPNAFSHLKRNSVFTAHLASVLRTMALAGRGVAWLPLSLITEDLEQGRLARASTIDCDIALDIRLMRQSERMGIAAETFWETLQSVQKSKTAQDAVRS
jgi:LysR family transcriptional regulator, hypochlorite-specific transcription factor HypT